MVQLPVDGKVGVPQAWPSTLLNPASDEQPGRNGVVEIGTAGGETVIVVVQLLSIWSLAVKVRGPAETKNSP
jgi:hypothetical protein